MPSVPSPAGEPETPKFFELPASTENGDALLVAVTDITANPFNDRDLGDLTGLSESIVKDDLLQDIAVMHTTEFAKFYPAEAAGMGTKYVLAFGERRWRAHMAIGRDEIPAVLRNDVAPKIRRVLFVENFHRKQLSAVEEARKFQRLHVEEGMSYREIVEELHLKSVSHVSRRLELLALPDELQSIVGTEDGPGVTLARSILSKFSEPENQIRAWHLIRDEEITLNEAVHRIHSGEDVPPGNDVLTQRTADTDEQGSKKPSDTSPAAGTKQTTPTENTQQSSGAGQAPKKETTKVSTGQKKPLADKEAVQRNHASADRDAACQHLIGSDTKLSSEQHDSLYARTLLAPMQPGPARTRSHRWLREAGCAEFTINDTDSYFEAVLSSGKAELINRVTFATALAAGEIRARDGRRQWDRTDAEHVRLLIEAGQYRPQTEWEQTQLTKFGVPFPGADETTDSEPID
ncbi:ParB/RepB/Spo0J family partition protein [Streptomyces sp. NPDC003016]